MTKFRKKKVYSFNLFLYIDSRPEFVNVWLYYKFILTL